MPHPRRVLIAGLAMGALLSTRSTVAQQAVPTSQQSPQPPLSGGVDLVTVGVRVVDKDARPVAGLTPDDFIVTLDGQARQVRALVPTATAQAGHGNRVWLVVVDDLSLRPQQAKDLLLSAEKLLSALDPGDLVGVETTSGLGPTVAPTRNHDAIFRALRNEDLTGRADVRPAKPFIGVNEAFDMVRSGGNRDIGARVVQRECSADSGSGGGRPRGGSGGGQSATPDDSCATRVVAAARALATSAEQTTRQQLSAYTRVMDSMKAISGVRTVIALTSGVALPLGPSDAIEILGRSAAEADVAFDGLIAVDATDPSEKSADRIKARRDESTFLTSGVEALALAAGGEAVRVGGEADRLYAQMVSESDNEYRLGIEAPAGSPKRYLAVKVTSKRPGVTVHASAEAVRSAVHDLARPTAEALKQRIEQGGTAFGVPIALTTSRRKDSTPARVQLAVDVDVPANTPAPVTAMFALINGAGAVVQSGSQELQSTPGDDYHLAFPLPVDAGDYRLRVAVADGHANLGSLDDVVAVRLPRLGALMTSDLITTSSRADGAPHLLALETLPPQALTLHVSLELYPDSQDATVLKVQLTMALASGGAPIVGGEIAPVARDGRLLVSATLPVAALRPDRYVITATVLAAGKPVGAVTATVKKVQ